MRLAVTFQVSVWCVITDCFGYSIVGCGLRRVLTLSTDTEPVMKLDQAYAIMRRFGSANYIFSVKFSKSNEV